MICQAHPVSEHGEPFAWCPKCGKHNCRFQGKLGEYIYLCSRCHGCYVCDHHSLYIGGKWWWVSHVTKSYEPVINDGRMQGPPINPDSPCPNHGRACQAGFLGVSSDTQ